jgi:thioredoxin-related protein
MRRWLLLPFLLLSSIAFGETSWINNYELALANAKQKSKPIFVDCFADWCVWCHRLEKEVYTDSKFETFLQGFIPLRLDVEDGADGSRVAASYGVDSLPSILILDSDGKLLNRIGGFMDANELTNEINVIQELIKEEKLHPGNLENVQTLAEEYLYRDMNAEAEVRFKKVMEAPEVPANEKESANFSLALTQYYQDKKDQALSTLDTYFQNYPTGASIEDAFLLRSQIYIEQDKKEQAKAVLQQFLVKFPNSQNMKRAKDVLDLLNHS